MVAAGQDDGALVLKYLQVFREFDTSGDGSICASELHSALERSGVKLTQREFRKFMQEVDTDGNGQIDFQEFCGFCRQLTAESAKNQKSKGTRLPRAYLTPPQFEQYATYFKNVAGEDGQIDIDELQEFFEQNRMSVSRDRLNVIMAEVDDDQSGQLDEGEFMVLLIKATGLKKRRVGPGLCPISQLRDEGWPLNEMRRLGYECKDFTDAGYGVSELIEVFSPTEFRRLGIGIKQLLEAGCWDGMQELQDAGCCVRKIRTAGWSDLNSAIQLRQLGVDAGRMKLGGWGLSDLRKTGYSLAELRLGGFSPASLSALEQVLCRQQGLRMEERRNTFDLREEADKKLVQSQKEKTQSKAQAGNSNRESQQISN